MSRIRLVPVLLGLFLMHGLGCSQEAPPADLPPRAIQWQGVSANAAAERRVIPGIVTAISNTALAFEVGGVVESVSVNLGDAVEEGQELARLDPEPLELVVRDADAALAEARALQESARADYERAARLFEARVLSRQEYERATAGRGSRDAQVAAARARLALARRELRRSVLRAPFGGVVSVRDVEPAMKITRGRAVLQLDSEEDGLRVEVQMPETRIARVRQGAEVSVTFPSLGGALEVKAVVSEVGSRASVGNSFPVRVDLRNAPPALRPGMTAEVTFTLEPSDDALAALDGVLIPMAATLAGADGAFTVFVFDRDTSRVNERRVLAGGIRDNEIAVLEGLVAGEIIATAGVSFLRDGQQVTLLGVSPDESAQ